jgi:multiple sugar transport system substrate-binding protein
VTARASGTPFAPRAHGTPAHRTGCRRGSAAGSDRHLFKEDPMNRTIVRAALTVALLVLVGAFSWAEKADVTFMTWESDTMNQKLLASFAQFSKDNPDITVKLIPSPLTDYTTKLNQMIAAGEAPDVFMCGNDWALQNAELGLTYDWTSYADKDFLSHFYAGTVENWTKTGKLAGLPGLVNCYGVFYNKKTLKEAGIADPKNGWTYDQVFAAARKLTKTVSGVKRPGFYGNMDFFNLSVYSVSAGGSPFANGIVEVTKVSADAKYKEGVQKYASLIKDGCATAPTANLDNMVTQFMQGQIPMMMYGQWAADELIRNAPKDLQWGYAPSPIVKTQAVIFDAVGWASPAAIKNPAAVWKVLKYIDTKSYEIVLPDTPVAPAAYKDSSAAYFAKLKALGHGDVATALDYMMSSPNKQPVRFNQTWAGDANKFINMVQNDILMGKQPVSKLDELVKSINAVIEQNQ